MSSLDKPLPDSTSMATAQKNIISSLPLAVGLEWEQGLILKREFLQEVLKNAELPRPVSLRTIESIVLGLNRMQTRLQLDAAVAGTEAAPLGREKP